MFSGHLLPFSTHFLYVFVLRRQFPVRCNDRLKQEFFYPNALPFPIAITEHDSLLCMSKAATYIFHYWSNFSVVDFAKRCNCVVLNLYKKCIQSFVIPDEKRQAPGVIRSNARDIKTNTLNANRLSQNLQLTETGLNTVGSFLYFYRI